MKKIKFIWLVVICVCILIAAGFLLYFINFHSHFSNASDDWANFAIFNSYFISVVNMIILGYISYITYETTKRFHELQIQPLLFLTTDTPERIRNVFIKDTWYVVNGAKSPAINLLVRYPINSNEYTKWVSCTSLAENQKLELFWIHWANKIEICFSDLTEENFYFFEYQDYNGKTTKIKKEKYNQFLKLAKDNRDNNITNLRDKMEKYLNSFEEGKNPMEDYTNGFIKQNLI